jgi:hypothetical protein
MSTWEWDLAPTNGEASDELVWKRLRLRRDTLLSQSDHRMVSDAPWDTAPWATYRQALRDLPEQTADPRAAVWPNPPSD